MSYAEQEILNPLVTALYDEETKEEVLSKDPQMNLADTILLIEAREAGKDLQESCLKTLQQITKFIKPLYQQRMPLRTAP